MEKELYKETFVCRVLELSQSNIWEEAILEWSLTNVEDNEDREYGHNNCICGHPIKVEYYYHNDITGSEIIVGSCCCKKFGFHYDDMTRYSTTKKKLPKKPALQIIDCHLDMAAKWKEAYIKSNTDLTYIDYVRQCLYNKCSDIWSCYEGVDNGLVKYYKKWFDFLSSVMNKNKLTELQFKHLNEVLDELKECNANYVPNKYLLLKSFSDIMTSESRPYYKIKADVLRHINESETYTDYERRFLTDIFWNTYLTPKQTEFLQNIIHKHKADIASI